MSRRTPWTRIAWVCSLLLWTVSMAAAAPPSTALLDTFDAVLQRVVALRQLRPSGPIRREVRSRAQLRQALRELLDTELSATDWATERRAMFAWGLLPADFPLRTFVLDLLTEQVAGYYDPKQRTLFIADWLPPEAQEPIMAHELVHALQDQHYDLEANFGHVKTHADLTLARKAVIEGDALAVMLESMLRPMGLSFAALPNLEALLQSDSTLMGSAFQVYRQAPPVLQQQLLFPYVAGLTFMQAALAHDGWQGLAKVYQQPPASTEQILHPETYFTAAPDWPSTVDLELPDALFQDAWRKLTRDVLGEFMLSVVLRQAVPEAEARASAAGWRGDRYELFQHTASGRLLLVAVTTWDSAAEAVEFFHSYVRVLRHKYPDWQQRPVSPDAYLWQRDAHRVWLSRRGHRVDIIEGAPAQALAELRRRVQTAVERPWQPEAR